MNIYQENGYKDRADYLNSLAVEYGVTLKFIYKIADTLGESEDFDNLITTIDDYFEVLRLE